MSKKEEAKTLIFQLVDQRPSNYVLDEDPTKAEMKAHITAASHRKILSVSAVEVWTVPKGGEGYWKLRPTRYIRGCDMIYVDEQDAAGIKPSPVNDAIWLKNGTIAVTQSGVDIGLYKYLTEGYSGNLHMIQTEKVRRVQGSIDEIEQLDYAEVAGNEETQRDLRFKADSYLQGLKSKVGNTTVYKEDAIEFLASLFKLPPFESGFKSEAWIALTEKMEVDPGKFMEVIDEKRTLIVADVKAAVQLNVIMVDQVKAAFVESKQVIKKFPETTTDANMIDILVDHLSSPSNAGEYGKLRIALKAAKDGSQGVLL